MVRVGAITLGLTAVACFVALPAAAGVRRLALVVGQNQGDSSEAVLAYAEADARRMAALLREIGSFDDVWLSLGPDADVVQSSLAQAREWIARQRREGEEAVFLFYYSGHGDGETLHLGNTRLTSEALLSGLERTDADLRLAVIDACGAGDFTREKGLEVGPPVRIELLDELSARGQAVIASTSASESAQESETLKGSFFTSYLVTGLRGPADQDGDGRVTLSEAYAYAYHRTVRSTVMSAAGIQHPTFRMDLSGQRDVALTWPGRSQSFLSFRPRTPGTFLVLTGDEEAVVGEIPSASDSEPRLGLPAGTYVVKKRSPAELKVARVLLTAGDDALLDEHEMEVVPYAVLSQKGGPPPSWLTLTGGIESPVLSVQLIGGFEVGWAVDLHYVLLWPVVAVDFGGQEIDSLATSIVIIGPALAVGYELHFGRFSALAGGQLGVPIFLQQVQGRRSHISAGFELAGLLAGNVRLTERLGLTLRCTLGSRWLQLAPEPDDVAGGGFLPRLVGRVHLGLRVRL